jgi:hypothetical protein
MKSAHQCQIAQAAEEKLNQDHKYFSSPGAYNKNTPGMAYKNTEYESGSGQYPLDNAHLLFTMRALQPHSDFELRAMGPEPTSYNYQHKQHQQMAYLHNHILGLFFQHQLHQNSTAFQFYSNSYLGFNPVIRRTNNPFSSSSVSNFDAPTAQYDSAVKLARSIPKKNGNMSPPPGMVKKPENGAMAKVSRNMSPKSVRSCLGEILNEEEIASFLICYPHVTNESELVFLAQSKKFDSY